MRGDGHMLFSISFIVSMIIVMLLILLVPIPYEKKPLLIGGGVSGLAILLSYITVQTLSIWVGMLFFIGIILSTAVLLGNKREWLVEKEQIEAVPKRGFHKIMKQFENPNARSVFDEEKSPLYMEPILSLSESIIPDDEHIDEEIKPIHTQEEPKIDTLKEPVNENIVEIEAVDLFIPPTEEVGSDELIAPEFEYENLIDEVAVTNIDYPTETIEKIVEEKVVPLQIDDSEELSDEWLSQRLDALFANEKSEEKVSKTIDEEEFEQLPLSSLGDLQMLSNDSVPEEIDTEFEDLSSIYFKKQRSDVNGTKE